MYRMNRIFPPEAVIKTDKGTFYLTITPFKNRNTGQSEYYTISLGGKTNKCVQLKVPDIHNPNQEGLLIWVESEISCYFFANTTNKMAIHMVNLGFTIAKDINPNCNRYIFDDCSSIKCKLPNGKSQVVSMKPYHIVFHGETWYEKYFGAKLVSNHSIYEKGKLGLCDSAKKTKTFDFIHSDLQEILTPIYDNSATWYDFFREIDTVFKEKKCAMVYPWLVSALLVIFDNNYIFENPKWYIDLSENKLAEKTPSISFISHAVMRGGKKTRKLHRLNYPVHVPYIINYPLVQSFNYKEYLQK